MFRKVLLILLLPLLAEVISSCCECIPPLTFMYTHTAFFSEVFRTDGNNPNTGPDSLVRKKNYVLGLQINRVRSNISAAGFVSKAYAFCNCPLDTYLPKDSIADIKIISLYDFNDSNPAGSDVSGYFKQTEKSPFILDFLKKYEKIVHDPYELTGRMWFKSDEQAKIKSGFQKFKMIVTLSDGRVFEDETERCKFTD